MTTKALKRHGELNDELIRIYPCHRDLVSSSSAARLNGHTGGHGNKAQLSREIEKLGVEHQREEDTG